MKVFLDDVRSPPDDSWIRTLSANETIECLKTGQVTNLSLDHDLGDESIYGTGYDVLLWIEQSVYMSSFQPPIIRVHSANPVARARMFAAIRSINRQIH